MASRPPSRYYVVQVACGREAAAARRLTSILPEEALCEPVFVPRFATRRKVRGAWVPVERDLLPGYVIAVSRDARALAKGVSASSGFAHVLAAGSGPVPLTRDEQWLFGGRGAKGGRCLPMSRAYKLPDGRVVIVDGPLAGRERAISRIDRRRCTATLSICVAGFTVEARAGLAVLPLPRDDAALARRLARQSAPVEALSSP